MQKEALNYRKILGSVITQIEQSKLRAFSEVNKALLQAYWNIGKELSSHSGYGKAVVERLSRDLRMRFPGIKGYSSVNLWNMKRFYENYPILQPVARELLLVQKMQSVVAELPKKLQKTSAELTNCRKLQTVSVELPSSQKLQALPEELLFTISWSNHLAILNMTQTPEEREFYIRMCIKERWGKRELKRQINSCLFERYMNADKPEKVTALIPRHKEEDIARHFKDDYVLEFLNLGNEYSEKELESAILGNLKDFFLEFGKSLTFVGSQYVIEIDGRENRIDLLFFDRELRCLVAIELKTGEFKAEYIGQIQKYLAALNEKVRLPSERESIGIVLCKSKGKEEVRFALAGTTSPLKVATYMTKLPSAKLILKKLGQLDRRKEEEG
ncbi:MAG: PDDEXK nuclease domain-containing protein [Candidatus Nanoarchaeia archaeon]|nr:PDDEXK nuclease domain-containing protein [Candidatus Nanoarchaeia archaeon]